MHDDADDCSIPTFEPTPATRQRLDAGKPSTRRAGPRSTNRDDAAIAERDNQRARRGSRR